MSVDPAIPGLHFGLLKPQRQQFHISPRGAAEKEQEGLPQWHSDLPALAETWELSFKWGPQTTLVVFFSYSFYILLSPQSTPPDPPTQLQLPTSFSHLKGQQRAPQSSQVWGPRRPILPRERVPWARLQPLRSSWRLPLGARLWIP